MNKLLPLFVLPLLLLSGKAQAAFSNQNVPLPTGSNQGVLSAPSTVYTTGFQWTPVTFAWSQDSSGHMAVGGTVDSNSRLSVNPQGTGENGLSVTMPAGSTGYAWRELSSTGNLLAQLDATGNLSFGGSSIQITGGNRDGIQFNSGYQIRFVTSTVSFGSDIDTGNGINRAFTITNSYTPVNHPLLFLKADSGQNADYFDVVNTTTNTTLTSIDKVGKISAPSYSILSGGITTAGLTQTVNGTTYTGGIATAYNANAASVSGPVNATVVSASIYSIVPNVDRFEIANATPNSVIFTLPDPTNYSGPEIDLTRNDTSSTNTVTITTAGTSKTITGYTSVTAQYQVRHCVRLADGSGWFVF